MILHVADRAVEGLYPRFEGRDDLPRFLQRLLQEDGAESAFLSRFFQGLRKERCPGPRRRLGPPAPDHPGNPVIPSAAYVR
jgi:hypothetical protein